MFAAAKGRDSLFVKVPTELVNEGSTVFIVVCGERGDSKLIHCHLFVEVVGAFIILLLLVSFGLVGESVVGLRAIGGSSFDDYSAFTSRNINHIETFLFEPLHSVGQRRCVTSLVDRCLVK